MTDAPASCPHCAVPMKAVTARARSGYYIVLDQCPRCGGLWCDRWELFPIASAEADRLDPVDEHQLRTAAASPAGTGLCPRCRTPLLGFHDPAIPADARIERCRQCDGLWLNRGELHRIKHQHPDPAPPATSEVLDKLVQACGSQATWATVPNLDSALREAAPAAAPDDVREQLWDSAGWLVLRGLIRLLLGI